MIYHITALNFRKFTTDLLIEALRYSQFITDRGAAGVVISVEVLR
jgi:myo-inositol-1-phosphate synthase